MCMLQRCAFPQCYAPGHVAIATKLPFGCCEGEMTSETGSIFLVPYGKKFLQDKIFTVFGWIYLKPQRF